MVGSRSAGERDAPFPAEEELSPRERRGLARCRRALERGRRVHGRPLASGNQGILVDLRGALGHVPASEVGETGAPRRLWETPGGRWEGWVASVGDDLVHLTGRRPGESLGEGALRTGEVVATGRSGARIRLDGDRSDAVLPWEELTWHPSLEPPRLEPGEHVAGRVIGITLDGPILSPRSLVPTPWPAIALALPPGTEVGVRVEARAGGRAQLRTDRSPRAVAVVATKELPPGVAPAAALEAQVVEVDPIAGALVLAELRLAGPSSRAAPRAPAARRPEPPGPEQAASGSCS